MKAIATLLLLAATSGAHAVEWEGWERLELRAHAAMVLSGTVEMRWSASDEERWLETETRARFFGASIGRSSTRSRLSAKDGRVLEYVDRQKERARRYTFGEEAYTVVKLKPGDDPDAPLTDWIVRSTARYPIPVGEDGNPVTLRDYYSTLMRLDELPLEKSGDACTVWVATSDGPQPYRLELGEARTVRLRLRLPGERKRRRVETRELRLRVTASDPERASSKFLGMQGEIEMWVEADSKTLVEVIGKVPRVPGKVRLEVASLR